MVVETFTTKVSITSGSQHFESIVLDEEKRDIEGSSEVVKDEQFATLLVEAVCDGGSGWLVDDAEDLEASNSVSILSRLTLCIVEV